jgi:NTE family protein
VIEGLKQSPAEDVTALVLSGGGARGAYAVGILQAVIEILGLTVKDPSPFRIYSGTSVGSINAAFLASHAQRGDLGIYKLRELWETLGVNSHLKVLGNVGDLRGLSTGWFANAILDSGPLQALVQGSVDFPQLHENVNNGLVRALMLAAFNIGTAQTTIFCEHHDSFEPRPSRDPTRAEVYTPIDANHILASAAMPFVFRARKVDDHYYCDGGVRFNTPISPAIRAGASRLVVISLNPLRQHAPAPDPLVGYPSVPFLIGRLLDALLLDPFEYDLEVVERFNRLSSAMQDALPRHTLERIRQVLVETRGAPYRSLETLVFSPSQDLGRLANEHLRQHLASYKLGAIPRYFLKKAANPNASWEADWAAYLLFDGKFAERLMQLGLQDAYGRRDEILKFFTKSDASKPIDTQR